MPPAIDAFPDVDLLVVNYLTAAPTLSFRVCTDLPLDITATIVRVARVAGANRSIRVDRPIVDVDVFSPDRAECIAAAREAQRLILFELRGSSTPDGYVQDASTIIGPHFLPDVNQALVRYSASYELHVHA